MDVRPHPLPTLAEVRRQGEYLVIETFTSVQGEGTRIGHLSTFMRLAHCNLACSWCDTTYSWKQGEMVEPRLMSALELAGRVSAPDVVITGGEPLLHDLAPLLDRLDGHVVTVETNATLFKPDARVGLWSLSPKLGSSGQRPDVLTLGRYLAECPDRVQLKFVVADEADLKAVKALLSELGEPARGVPLVIQPVGQASEGRDAYCERMRTMIEDLILPDPFWGTYSLRYLPQFHRLLWLEKRGI